MTFEIGAASFCVIATLPSGFRVSFDQRQTRPRQAARSRVKQDEMRLSLVHEESQRGRIKEGGRSPTTIMVPSWQQGQRERSIPDEVMRELKHIREEIAFREYPG